MRPKKYACPNDCQLPPRKKVLTENADHTYGFDYNDFTYCPVCGSLMPYSLKKIKNFFDVYHPHPLLHHALNLIYKSEFEAAAREAFVVVESALREKVWTRFARFRFGNKSLVV